MNHTSNMATAISANRHRPSHRQRRGSIAVLAAVLLIVMVAMVAFAVDTGYLAVAKTETQRTADTAAHAAVIEFARNSDAKTASDLAHQISSQYSAANPVLGSVAEVADQTDVVVGHYEFGSGQSELYYDDPSTFNAVRVRIRRNDSQNGSVPLFFGGVLGNAKQAIESEATAALIRNVSGFKIPASGENVPMLPLTVSEKEWNKAMNGVGIDTWSYDPATKTVSFGSDGVRELVLFPTKTGSSGNLGTVNIGTNNNSTSYLANQIRNGLDSSALNYHGGTLELDSSGELELTGNPGLSASMKDEFDAIVGKERIIMLYRSVHGNGSGAVFKVVQFVGIRVMSAKLNGGVKRIVIQPASITYNGVIQGSGNGKSSHVYSSPRLVN